MDYIKTEKERRRVKIIEGDLILKKDTIFEESIKVKGDIRGFFTLRVIGNIKAKNIDVKDIKAWDVEADDIYADEVNVRDIIAKNINVKEISAMNIEAGDINTDDIDAWDINCGCINANNIDAGDIICEKRIKKTKKAKTICRIFIQNKSKLERKEQMKK